MLIRLYLLITLGFVSIAVPAFGDKDPPVETILERMMAHNEWQTTQLLEYKALRMFYAANPRFRIDSSMLVETSFKKSESMDSKILKQDGSKLIRERVFDKILEAENETSSTQAKREVDITPANYVFTLAGTDICGERRCYRLTLFPKRKDKYSIQGEVWIDADDFAIVRVRGTPAKPPSFWTRRTQIERHYARFNGIWLTERIESTSDILFAGQSQLSINYSYDLVQTMN